jgi:hypothetical protein
MRRWVVALVLAAVLVAPQSAWADGADWQTCWPDEESVTSPVDGWVSACYSDGALD